MKELIYGLAFAIFGFLTIPITKDITVAFFAIPAGLAIAFDKEAIE